MKRGYILITPVHNEEEFIGDTIKSVVSQSVRPKKWIIVDDASTDSTGEIVKSYESRYDFIDYYQLPRSNVKSYYSHRAEVFLAGYERVRRVQHDFVASLDGDLTLPQDYYEGILKEFENNLRIIQSLV